NQAARHFDIDCSMISRASSKWKAKQRRKVSGLLLAEKPYFQKQRKSFIPGLYSKEPKSCSGYITIRNKILEILKEPEMVVLYGKSATVMMLMIMIIMMTIIPL